MTRREVLSQACDQCMKELYKYVYPRVSWKNFKKECAEYTKKYKVWEQYNKIRTSEKKSSKDFEEWDKIKSKYPDWYNKSITECIGPRPYEFYYLPKEIMKDICDSYVYAYSIDNQQELLNTISILKHYCREPIVDKYIKGKGEPGDDDFEPGHRGYEHPDNLEKEITKILTKYDDSIDSEQGEEVVNKFFEFLDMAGNFYNWNQELNSFNITVYLGPSPNSNKETVIENWKKYRNKTIKINEKKLKEHYYGDDEVS